MKKIISVLLAVFMIIQFAPELKAAPEPYEEVVNKIDQIGSISSSNYMAEKTKINEARTAYLNLSKEQRRKVSNYSKLIKSMEDYYDQVALNEISLSGTTLSIGTKQIKSIREHSSFPITMATLKADYIEPMYEFEQGYNRLSTIAKGTPDMRAAKRLYDERRSYLDDVYYDGYKFTNRNNEVFKFLKTYSQDSKFKVLLKILIDVGVFVDNPIASSYEDPLPYEKAALQDMLSALGYKTDDYTEDSSLTNIEKVKKSILEDYFKANDPTIRSLIEANEELQRLIGSNTMGNYVNTVNRFFSNTLVPWKNYANNPPTTTNIALKDYIERETRYLLNPANAGNHSQFDPRKEDFQKLFNLTSGNPDNVLAEKDVEYPDAQNIDENTTPPTISPRGNKINNLEDLFKQLSVSYAKMDYRIVNNPTVQARKRQVDKWYQDSLQVIYDENRIEGFKREAKTVSDLYSQMSEADKENPSKINGILGLYNGLSFEAKSFLTEENIGLNKLLAKAKGILTAKNFLANPNTQSVLGLNPDTVEETSRSNIEERLQKYKTDVSLSGKETTVMKAAVKKMEELLKTLNERKNDAWRFKIENARLLELEPSDIFPEDKGRIVALENAYNSLTGNGTLKIKDNLAAEKAKIDGLVEALSTLEALDFVANHPVIKKETATVAAEDEAELKTALNDFAKLSDKAKNLVKTAPILNSHHFKENCEKLDDIYEAKIKDVKLSDAPFTSIVDLEPNDVNSGNKDEIKAKIETLRTLIGDAKRFAMLFESVYPIAGTPKTLLFEGYLNKLKALLEKINELEANLSDQDKANAFAEKHKDILEFLSTPGDAKMRDGNKKDNFDAITKALDEFKALSDGVKGKLENPGATYTKPNGTSAMNTIIKEVNLNAIKNSVELDIEAEKAAYTGAADFEKSLTGIESLPQAEQKHRDFEKLEKRAESEEEIAGVPNTPYIKELKRRIADTLNELKQLHKALNDEIIPILKVEKALEDSNLLSPGTSFEDPENIKKLQNLAKLYKEIPGVSNEDARRLKENLENKILPLIDRMKNLAAQRLIQFEQKYARLLNSTEVSVEDYGEVLNALNELTPIEKGLFDDQIAEKDRAALDRSKLEDIKTKIGEILKIEAEAFLLKHSEILNMKNPLSSDPSVMRAKELDPEHRNEYFNRWLELAKLCDEEFWKLKDAVQSEVNRLHSNVCGKTVVEDISEKIAQLEALLKGESYENPLPNDIINAAPFIPNKNIVPYDYEWKIRFNQPISEYSLSGIYVYDAQSKGADGIIQRAPFVIPELNLEGDVVTLRLRGGFYQPGGKYYIYISNTVHTTNGKTLFPAQKMIFRVH